MRRLLQPKMPTILGIESTCDETGAAVVFDGRAVKSNVVATQVELHAKYRGVVLEIIQKYVAGQPVLVGTRSIEVSERVSERLLNERPTTGQRRS